MVADPFHRGDQIYYSGVTSVSFVAAGGYPWPPYGSNGATHFAMDNVTIGSGGAGEPDLHFLPPQVSGGNLQLLLGTVDGSPLPAERAARIAFYGTTNVSLASGNWLQLTNPTVLSNGVLRVDGQSTLNAPRRFFRAVQTP